MQMGRGLAGQWVRAGGCMFAQLESQKATRPKDRL